MIVGEPDAINHDATKEDAEELSDAGYSAGEIDAENEEMESGDDSDADDTCMESSDEVEGVDGSKTPIAVAGKGSSTVGKPESKSKRRGGAVEKKPYDKGTKKTRKQKKLEKAITGESDGLSQAN